MNGSVGSPRGIGDAKGLAPGDTIGSYELVFRAAEGGMATIWAARRRGSRGFSQLVAVKVLSDLLREDPDGRAMFLDEARTAARIIHPNVCQVLDYGEDGGRPYMVMEWIEGESLARIAAAQRMQGERLPLRWVLHVAAAACAGLHAAHEAHDDDGEPMNLVHRDVSPQNIMVTWGGVTKIVDFGVAKSRRRSQVTRVGVIKGKTSYFSPEQIRVEALDRRSDIFSFGIMLYVLITDHHPFRGRCALETVQNIATKDPFPPRELLPDLPPELDALILRALARDPDARFPTAAELGRALERLAVTLGAAEASAEEYTMPSGGVLSARQVGALVEAALPGVALVRRARIARATDLLDQARALAEAAERISFDEITLEEITDEEEEEGEGARREDAPTLPMRAQASRPAHPPVREESTRRGGPVSRTPHATAIAAPAAPAGGGRGSLVAVQALVLLGAAALTMKISEQHDAGAGRAAEAHAGVALSAARILADALTEAEALAGAEKKPVDDGREAAPTVETQALQPVRTTVEAPPPAPSAPLPVMKPKPAPRAGAASSEPYEPTGL